MGLDSFFSGGGSQSDSNAFSALRGLQDDNGGFYVNNVAKRMPGDYDQLMANMFYRATTPFTMPNLSKNGLYQQQEDAFRTVVGDTATRFSAGLANRGFVTPENINAIAGSTAQQAAPMMMPTISANIENQFRMPEEVSMNRFRDLMEAMQMGQGYLGQQSSQSMKNKAPGLGYGLGDSFFRGFGGGLGSGLGQGTASALKGGLSNMFAPGTSG